MAIQTNFSAARPSLLLDFANTKRLDSRITFTRTTTATYYDGVTTAKAEENFLLYSQEFDNASWTKQACGATANTTAAPDGTTTAETITLAVGAGVHAFYQTISAFTGGRVASIFVKAGTHQYVQLSFNSDATPWANFTITAGAGAVGSTGTNQTASIVDAGNGWYRCVLYTASTTATNFYVTVVSSSTSARQESWIAAGTETIYIWGAQLEQRSSVTAYTATTTQPITNYIPVLQTANAGQARFDHNPVTRESLGLLVEEQRSNLFTYSADFSNASWLKTRSGVIPNTVIAPDGTLTGDYFYADGTGVAYLYKQVTLTQNQPYTMSCFVKQGNLPTPTVRLRDFTEAGNVVFDIVSGTISTAASGICSNASIVNVGNGWFRISAVFTPTIATGNHNISPVHIDNNGTAIFGFYCWGAQLEAGAFSTSYIPTVASSATRNADVANIAGSNFTSWYNQGEGTVYVELASRSPLTGTQSVALNKYPTPWRIEAGTTDTIILWYGIVAEFFIGGSAGYNNIGTVPAGFNKFALGFSSTVGQAASSLNGATAISRTGALIGTATNLSIGNKINNLGGSILNGTIKKLAYYRKRLTNSQLQALTS